jgi:lysophospholipase L1-like esterase
LSNKINTVFMKRLSVYVNIMLLALLAFIAYRERYIPRLKQKLLPDNSLTHYQSRPAYKEQLSRYDVYTKKANIVMLGTSLTQDIDWGELLNRGDVVNRGYGGDILAVLAGRMPYVLSVQPKICFVEGGINDIDTGVPLTESVRLLTGIADTLQQHSVVPVLTAVTHVAKDAVNQKERNEKITAYNRELYKLAESRKLAVVDNNPALAPDGYLKPALAKGDGLHYLPSTYLLWKAAIEKVLVQNGLQ